jgi:hypothetical protein
MIQKKAVSDVIATVLIILVVLAAIIIVWNMVKKTVYDSSNEINVERFSISLSTQTVNLSGMSSIPVVRSAGAGNISAIEIVFKNSSGSTFEYRNNTRVPGELETVYYTINLSGRNVVSFEVYPIFVSDGKEKVGLKADSREQINQTNSHNPPIQSCTPNANVCLNKQCGTFSNGTCGSVSCGTCTLGNCNSNGQCVVGVMPCAGDGSLSSSPGASCLSIKQKGFSTSGIYWIDSDNCSAGQGAYQVYCDMNSFGGGWTLVMKIDGTKTTFGYNDAYWTANLTYNPNYYNFDRNETKLQSYNTLAFNEVMLEMQNLSGTSINKINLSKSASSMLSLINSGNDIATGLGRNTWLGLLPEINTQPNCNKEGFNLIGWSNGYLNTRIGLLMNNENDCSSPDWVIGFGVGGTHIWQSSGHILNSVGGGQAGYTNSTYGWIFVR